jgi:hypothetical protein
VPSVSRFVGALLLVSLSGQVSTRWSNTPPASKNALRKALYAPVVRGTVSFQFRPNSPPRVSRPSDFSISCPAGNGFVVYFSMSFLLSFVGFATQSIPRTTLSFPVESPFHPQGET